VPGRAELASRFRVGEVPPLSDGFTDRPDSAGDLVHALVPGSSAALVSSPAATGSEPNWLGASGKTQIAAMAAESLWRSRAIDALIWISATSRASVLSGYVEASVAATGIAPTGTAESVAARFTGWLSETGSLWLVVLDALQETTDLAGLWPRGATGRLLVSTNWPAAVAGRAQVLPVGPYSIREALNGLSERLTANPAQRLGAIDLVEALGREPLALAQASSVIANSSLACRDYRDYFVRRREQIEAAAGGEVPAAAMVTWTLSLGQAESILPGASVRLMVVLVALLDGNGIPGAIFGTSAVAGYMTGAAVSFPAAADPRPAWDALLALERAGLVSVNRGVTPPTVRMTSAIQAAVRTAAPAQAQAAAGRAAASALLEVWPADEPQAWTAASLRANAASLQGSAADVLWVEGCHPLLTRAGRSLDQARMVGPAVEYWRDLAARCDTKLPPGHPDILIMAAQLADAYLAAGLAEDAVQWYQRVLAERGRETAPGHPAIVAIRVSLARALVLAGEPGDAVTVMLRAVSECEQFRGPGHPETLSARDELAAAYRAAGDVAAASSLLARSLKERETLYGPRDAQTIATRDRLAAVSLAEGRIKDAIKQYKRALSDREQVLGRDHPDTIATRANLSVAYQAAGRIPDAMQLAEQCCADSERVFGPDHADTLARMANLAQLYYAAGRVGDAITVLRQTAIRCDRTLPPGDPLTQAVHQSLLNMGRA
jgi:tetratricopeptide (TPR) repeat protein